MMKYETNQMNNSTSKGYSSSPHLLTLFNKCASTREVLAFNNVHVERGAEILQGLSFHTQFRISLLPLSFQTLYVAVAGSTLGLSL